MKQIKEMIYFRAVAWPSGLKNWIKELIYFRTYQSTWYIICAQYLNLFSPIYYQNIYQYKKAYLIPVVPNRFLTRGDLSLSGHLASSGKIFGCHNQVGGKGVPLAFSG